MQKDRIPLEDIKVLSAGQASIINCPSGPRYHDITLEVGDSAASDGTAPDVADIVDEITVRYNGEDIWKITGARLDAINAAKRASMAAQKYNGASAGTGRVHLPLFFADPSQDAISQMGVDRELMALPTDWLPSDRKLQIYVKTQTGITPVINAVATVDYVSVGRPVPVMKIETHDFNVSSASLQLTNQLPKTGLLSQLSFFDTSDGKTVENVEVKIGRVSRWNLSKNQNTTEQKKNELNPAAGAYHCPFDMNNGIVDMWNVNGSADVVVNIDFSAAATGSHSVVSMRYELPKTN